VPDRSLSTRQPRRRPAALVAIMTGIALLLPLQASAGPAGRSGSVGAGAAAIHDTDRQLASRAVDPLIGLPSTAGGSVARLPDRLAPPAATAFDPTRVNLSLEQEWTGLSKPVLLTNAGDGSGRLFVVEQTGRIRVISSAGVLLATPYLDFTGLVAKGSEQGVLGLAFHPRFEQNGYLYVNYTTTNGDTFVNRYTANPTANTVDRATGVRIMTIDQPYSNHNGGNLAFGPDGYLYIGTGDGGSVGDPGNRAQSVNSLLGKILRIDVDHTSTGKRYRSPVTNPYVGRTGLDEIWSRGLRNPWRFSFDPATKALWIGDVGQGRYEEVDRANRSSSTIPGGRAVNFGWRQLEGRACYNPSRGCSTTGKQPPLTVYAHAVSGADNCSITGGFVYRGTANPVLAGGYVYGDFCSGRIWVVSAGAYTPATGRQVHGPTDAPNLMISSFGQDEDGELYVCDLGGTIYRINATSL
jgi:glucose/arabinose dehydrogenase